MSFLNSAICSQKTYIQHCTQGIGSQLDKADIRELSLAELRREIANNVIGTHCDWLCYKVEERRKEQHEPIATAPLYEGFCGKPMRTANGSSNSRR